MRLFHIVKGSTLLFLGKLSKQCGVVVKKVCNQDSLEVLSLVFFFFNTLDMLVYYKHWGKPVLLEVIWLYHILIISHVQVCFLPGTLALGATKGITKAKAMEENLLTFEDLENLKLAEDLAKTCYEMYSVTSTGLAPEIAYFNSEVSCFYIYYGFFLWECVF